MRLGAESQPSRSYAIIGCVAAPYAELSSLASSLEDVSRRVAAIADGAAAEDDDETAAELFAVERALVAAHRRLSRISSGPRRS